MRSFIVVGSALSLSVAGFVACGGDDTIFSGDAGGKDAASGQDAAPDVTVDDSSGGEAATDSATRVDTGSDGAPTDTGADTSVRDAGVEAAVPARLLLSYNASTTSELVAFNIGTGQVDGRLTYPGFIGTTSTQSSNNPYLLEQANDVVGRLGHSSPWILESTWSVKLADRADGGASYSDPAAVLVGAGTKAYVLRYTRNQIAIVDTSQNADAGAPVGTIDLAGLLQTGDTDGTVEMTAGVYVPSKRLVYVVLGNINRNNVSTDGYTLLCSPTVSNVIAIDVDTDKVVKLNGGGANGALALVGTNPVFGGLAYDAASDRLLILHAGCNTPADGGGAGAVVKRRVEELSLFTGETRMLFDATSKGFPSGFVFIDPQRAVLQFDFTGFETYAWDPRDLALGAAITNAPDSFVYDGAGNLLGLSTSYLADGGIGGIDVLSVRIADGRKTKLGTNPFSLAGGFVGGVDLWPHP